MRDGMLIKTIDRAIRKSCCGNCNSGKPCCGGNSHFEKRGDLWWPTNTLTVRRSLVKLNLPRWPRDREFILQVEKIMPIRFVRSKYGDQKRWQRQFQAIKNLVTLPPDQWGGLARWDLPAYMPSYDMTCTGCCGVTECCCNDPPPSTLFITITASGGSCSDCNGGNSLVTNQALPATSICTEFPPNGSFTYQEHVEFFFCACDSLTFECSGGANDIVELTMTDTAGGDSPNVFGNIHSCNPFSASGGGTVGGADLTTICSDPGTTGETFTFSVSE